MISISCCFVMLMLGCKYIVTNKIHFWCPVCTLAATTCNGVSRLLLRMADYYECIWLLPHDIVESSVPLSKFSGILLI